MSLVVSGAVTVGFYYVTNSTQNLVLSCVFEALTSLGISLVYCVIVDMFPTNLRWANYDSNFFSFPYLGFTNLVPRYRVMAAALSLTMGRLGALIGNLVFGYLIDLACVIPIILFAAFLFGKKIFLVKFSFLIRTQVFKLFLKHMRMEKNIDGQEFMSLSIKIEFHEYEYRATLMSTFLLTIITFYSPELVKFFLIRPLWFQYVWHV